MGLAGLPGSQLVGKSVSGNFKLSDILPQLTVPESFVVLLMKSPKSAPAQFSNKLLSPPTSLPTFLPPSLSPFAVFVWLHISTAAAAAAASAHSSLSPLLLLNL